MWIVFYPERLSFRELLDLFFQEHETTQCETQGIYICPGYPSAILSLSEGIWHSGDARGCMLASRTATRSADRYEAAAGGCHDPHRPGRTGRGLCPECRGTGRRTRQSSAARLSTMATQVSGSASVPFQRQGSSADRTGHRDGRGRCISANLPAPR